MWNSLPNYIVCDNTTNMFKNRLDNLWQSQDIVYDFKANSLNRKLQYVVIENFIVFILMISVCISVPLWQIRIFGLFFTPNPDIRIFFVQVLFA